MKKIVALLFIIPALIFAQHGEEEFILSQQQASAGGGDVPRQQEIIIQSSQIIGTADHTNFVVMVTADMLDDEVLDGGTNSAKANGDDIQVFSDASLTTRLSSYPYQFVASTTPGDRRCTLFVKIPILDYDSNSSIYIRYNDDTVTQPAPDAPYGREDVWSGFVVASLDGFSNEVDSDGDDTSLDFTAVTTGSTVTNSNPFGNADFPIMDFDTDELYYADVTGFDPSGGITFCSWLEFDTAAQFERIVNLVVDATTDCQLQLCHTGAVQADRIAIGYETSVGFISTANTTRLDGYAAGSWHFAGGSTDATDDIDLFVSGTTGTGDGATALSSGPTGQERFYLGGRGDDTSNFDGRAMVWLLEGDKGFGWIETFYNNTSSPATFGIGQTPINANQ
nr:hypothetical protein [uncultured Allomuricauda sp.]